MEIKEELLKLINEDRLKVVEKLRELGIEPYPYSYEVTSFAKEIKERFEEMEGKEVSIAGRVISIREHGKSKFMDIRDSSGDIQVYLKKDLLEPVKRGEIDCWKLTSYITTTDIIGVKGEVFKTKRGEISVRAKEIDIIAKALTPIPFGKQKGEQSWYAVTDPEVKYRNRYIYWNVYPKEREKIIQRERIISKIREFMNKKGFIEVSTPTLEILYGGAEARPFETKIWALDWEKVYLRISPELYLKRYIVGGFQKVYTICQNFRNEGIDKYHYPEFTMMEWYEAFTDYNYQMNQVEELLSTIVKELFGTYKIKYQDREIDFAPPFERMTIEDAITKFTSLDGKSATTEQLKKFLEENGIVWEGKEIRGFLISEVFDKFCQEKIWNPTFIIDHPKEISPLTKDHREKEGAVERFELIIAGMEIGNAYSELNDPVEQFHRFQLQRELYIDAEVKHHPMDLDFIYALSCGMPPCGGVGLGIDRIIMILTDSASIRDVIGFPLLKPKIKEEK